MALGDPTIRAGAENALTVKVRVCDPLASTILRLSNVATPAVVERTRVPDNVPEPEARETVIEYLEAWLFAALRTFENSSLKLATGEGESSSPRFLFSVAVVGTLVRVSELGTPYSGKIPSTVAGVKLPVVWLNVSVEAGELRARFPEIELLAARLIVPPA